MRAAWSEALALVLLAAACGRTNPADGSHDGTAGAGGGGTGGQPGRGGALGSGGGTTSTLPGVGGAGGGGMGSGGTPGTGGTGGGGGRPDGGGAGGAGATGQGGMGTGGAGRGGNTGAGGTGRDAASPDLPRDLGAGGDARPAADALDGCGPGYPLGSSRPAGDGCNTCVCNAGGIWACTLLYCPPPDAAGADRPSEVPGPAQDAPRDLPAAEAGGAACSEVKTAEACEARADCHPVFADANICDCASPGCCMMFDRCGDGAQADCKGPALCKMMEPPCGTNYVIAYQDACYEGCVSPNDCAP